MRVTLADGSYIDWSTTFTLFLKLCGNLLSSLSGLCKIVDVVCHVLHHVLPNLISNMVLGME